MKRAVVSGLGPNGMLAALELLRAGYDVTGVEQRTSYARTIHLSLRKSWFDDVRSLDAELCAKLERIASPIEAIEHLKANGDVETLRPGASPGAGGEPKDSPIDPLSRSPIDPLSRSPIDPLSRSPIDRLSRSPIAHVRLDELEGVFYEHLQAKQMRLLRGAQLVLGATSEQRFSASCASVHFDAPDLIVVAEGGKSPSAQLLGKRSLKLSAPKLYISVHVEQALGPVTRRVDTAIEVPSGGHVRVSFWATGHRDPAKGTWLVLEVPALLHAGKGSHTFDKDYFETHARQLLNAAPTTSTEGLRGTFKFEQQLLSSPTAGENVVFFGDAAGMGHHALGTGLELGACDLGPLRALIDGGDINAYGRSILQSRIALLAFGMKEYYPDIDVDPTPWLTQALAAAAADPEIEPRDLVESWVLSRA